MLKTRSAFQLTRALGLLACLALVTSNSARAAEVTGADGEAVSADDPQRIVSINPSVTQTLFAMGLGDRVVGTDDASTYPEAAADLPKLGYPYRIEAEGIIGRSPDLVIGTEDNMDETVVRQLRSVGVSTLVLPRSDVDGIDGLNQRIETIAQLVGRPEAGEELVSEINAKLEQLQTDIEQNMPELAADPPQVLFLYAHGPSAAYTYGEKSGSATLIRLAGGENAMDFTEGRNALTAEAMVRASPDVIIMLDRGLDAVGGVDGALQLPGVAQTPAGQNRRIFGVNDNIRWVSPRFPEFARNLAQQLAGQAEGQGDSES